MAQWMKAVVVTHHGGPDGLKLVSLEVPTYGAHEVLIKAHATSVNFVDIKERLGIYPEGKALPYVPGIDVYGEIVSKGNAVTEQLSIGQKVIALTTKGTYQSYVVAPEMLVLPISNSIASPQLAAFPAVAATAYMLLVWVGRLKKGETVLIQGGNGGVGTITTQLAHVLGAEKIFVTINRFKNTQKLFEIGATHVFKRNPNMLQAIIDEIKQGGVDVILDPVGGHNTQRYADLLSFYGRLIQYGNAGGTSTIVDITDGYKKCQTIAGFSLITTMRHRPALIRQALLQMLNYLQEGKIRIVVDRQYRLEEASMAHQYMESGKHFGKILLTMDH